MRILHLMLSNYYIDNVTYQENLLTRQNLMDGHLVRIIASTETFVSPNRLGYVKPSTYTNEDGIEVTRIPYRKLLPLKVMAKIRSYSGLYKMIENFKPDVILHHGVPSYELLTLVKYKKKHPNIKLYLDSHEDFHNSARNFISREILHRSFYGPIARKAIAYVDKILCINIEAFDFLNSLYKIPFEKMELFPLGGIIFPENEVLEKRLKIRNELGISRDEILMVHTGKMQKRKRTVELLKAFVQVKDEKMKLYLIGELTSDVESAVKPIIKSDERIKHLGWMSGDKLIDFLCATDVYLQPGSQSATLQNAICCGCAVMIFPHKSHVPYLNDNGYYVKTEKDMINVFEK
ncbi:MAG: glycosyltransferase family 4 protein, partial [Clostridiales bacterium]|nr:glycosyltransferase family 4 protein [Clostridiales bacterium]